MSFYKLWKELVGFHLFTINISYVWCFGHLNWRINQTGLLYCQLIKLFSLCQNHFVDNSSTGLLQKIQGY